ncbi:hypothetical protein C8J56DRAFT_896317 [Mycena floridula]|nr:hypothetical protein C8J56DRAFT_896317 [Mycena floridula]
MYEPPVSAPDLIPPATRETNDAVQDLVPCHPNVLKDPNALMSTFITVDNVLNLIDIASKDSNRLDAVRILISLLDQAQWVKDPSAPMRYLIQTECETHPSEQAFKHHARHQIEYAQVNAPYLDRRYMPVTHPSSNETPSTKSSLLSNKLSPVSTQKKVIVIDDPKILLDWDELPIPLGDGTECPTGLDLMFLYICSYVTAFPGCYLEILSKKNYSITKGKVARKRFPYTDPTDFTNINVAKFLADQGKLSCDFDDEFVWAIAFAKHMAFDSNIPPDQLDFDSMGLAPPGFPTGPEGVLYSCLPCPRDSKKHASVNLPKSDAGISRARPTKTSNVDNSNDLALATNASLSLHVKSKSKIEPDDNPTWFTRGRGKGLEGPTSTSTSQTSTLEEVYLYPTSRFGRSKEFYVHLSLSSQFESVYQTSVPPERYTSTLVTIQQPPAVIINAPSFQTSGILGMTAFTFGAISPQYLPVAPATSGIPQDVGVDPKLIMPIEPDEQDHEDFDENLVDHEEETH